MRLHLVAATPIIVGLVFFACSSPSATTEEDTKASDPIPEAGTTTTENPEPEVVTPPPDLDAGATDSAATPNTSGDAGAQCQPDSLRESQGNDTAETADALEWKTGSVCGQLNGTDVDFFTFTIPQSQNGFQFQLGATPRTRNYNITCTVAGQTFDFNSRRYPFVMGQPYVCKVALNPGAQPVDYRVNLTVQAF